MAAPYNSCEFLFVAVFCSVVLARLFSMMHSVVEVAFRYVSMVASFFMIAVLMVLRGRPMMVSGMVVVLCGFAVVFRGFFGHLNLSL